MPLNDPAEELQKLCAFAMKLADDARTETLAHFRQNIAVTNKQAGQAFDPVTLADQQTEQKLRTAIEKHYPDHGILGEEVAEKHTGSAWRWVLDPIDGTRAYVCGVPTWTTLIALERDGLPVLGIIDQPCLDERWLGMPQETTFLQAGAARKVTVSSCQSIADARFTTTDLRAQPHGYFTDEEKALASSLSGAARLSRFSLDAYGYGLLASGHLDLILEAGLKYYDAAALIPIITGAGGRINDWQGEKLTQSWAGEFSLGGKGGQIIAAASDALMEEAMAFLS